MIAGSSIWSSDWKAERASTYGVDAEDDLQAFYRGRTQLGVNVYPEDVAEAIAFFAGPRSAKSTGNVINVDGGVTAAYTAMKGGVATSEAVSVRRTRPPVRRSHLSFAAAKGRS